MVQNGVGGDKQEDQAVILTWNFQAKQGISGKANFWILKNQFEVI